MSVHRKGDRWVVRWREDGRQRSRSFTFKHQAEEYDRYRERAEWRQTVATPQGTVPAATVDEGVSFAVAERLADSQRSIHGGFFTSIRLAEAYRRQMPDADQLDIVLFRNRYPSRNLTDAEISAGEVDESIRDSVKELLTREAENA